MSDNTVYLRSSALEFEVGGRGGCMRRLKFNHCGRWLALMREAGEATGFAETACFPMAPYCGRVSTPDGRPGILVFAGREYPLGDEAYQREYAIHGPVCRFEWKIEQSGNNAILECVDSEAWANLFPFKFAISCKYRLRDAALLCETKLTNTGRGELPAGFGYHPFWVRDPAGVGAYRWVLKDGRGFGHNSENIDGGD